MLTLLAFRVAGAGFIGAILPRFQHPCQSLDEAAPAEQKGERQTDGDAKSV